MQNKPTALLLASKEGHVDVVQLLLDHHVDITKKDSMGQNCLDLAIEHGHRYEYVPKQGKKQLCSKSTWLNICKIKV